MTNNRNKNNGNRKLCAEAKNAKREGPASGAAVGAALGIIGGPIGMIIGGIIGGTLGGDRAVENVRKKKNCKCKK